MAELEGEGRKTHHFQEEKPIIFTAPFRLGGGMGREDNKCFLRLWNRGVVWVGGDPKDHPAPPKGWLPLLHGAPMGRRPATLWERPSSAHLIQISLSLIQNRSSFLFISFPNPSVFHFRGSEPQRDAGQHGAGSQEKGGEVWNKDAQIMLD